jgi:hypothetical protein
MAHDRQRLCVETKDCSVAQFPATALILGQPLRDAQSQGARLGRQFLPSESGRAGRLRGNW